MPLSVRIPRIISPVISPVISPLVRTSVTIPPAVAITTPVLSPINRVASIMTVPNVPVLTQTSIPLMHDPFESGLHYDPMAQRQIIKDVKYRFLDKWLFEDFAKLFKYLKVVNGSVKVTKGNDNKGYESASAKDNELKADFIENNVLDIEKTRKILTKVINENSLKWYDLPHNYTLVKHVVYGHVKRALEKMM